MTTRILALDIGTTAVKAGVFVDGAASLVVEEGYPLAYPSPGWVEQSPADWWDAAVRAVQRLDVATGVDAVALTGQMQDVVLLEGNGRPVRAAVLYADQRAVAEHDEVAAELGDAWPAAVGQAPDATNCVAKLRWLRAHDPTAWAAARAVTFGGAGAVVARMTGRVVCDPTTAATTGLYDVAADAWWAPAVHAAGLDAEGGPRIAELVPSTEAAGGLTAESADALGLAAGTPVVCGAGDVIATTVGIVGLEPGGAYAYLGTSAWVAVTTAGPQPRPGVIVLPGLRADHAVATAPLAVGAGVADWARDALLGGIDAAGLDALAADACGAAEGVVFLPHLDGRRGDGADPHATGVLVGVRRSTSAATVAAAVLEGVAHALRGLVETVTPGRTELAVCGGAARSTAWLGVLADVLGMPVHAVADEQASLRGAVSCGLVALGHAPLAPLGPERTVHPRPDRVRAHRAVVPLHDGLPDSLRSAFATLAAVRGSASPTHRSTVS